MKDNGYEIANDEISLLDIVDFFKKSWKKILLGGVVGGTLSAGYALLLPNIYQATAIIQVSKVANIEIEAPNVLLQKIKTPSYYSLNTFVSCKLEKSAEPGMVLVNSLNSSLVNNSSLILIQYKGKTTEQAIKCLESIIIDIRKNQNEIATPIFEIRKKQLYNFKQKLEAIDQITKNLSSKKLNFDFSDQKLDASILLATTLIKKNEISDLRTQIYDLEILLEQPHTKIIDLIAPIYAPNHHLEPKRTLITLGGGIAGIVLVIVFLLGRKTWANLQKSKPII